MNPENGEIYAISNYPTFDPNTITEAARENIANRAVQSVYSPGSVFKLITYSGALEKHLITPEGMGDVGSLAIGGALGTVAILTKQEFLLPFIGGVFILEALSVMLQVSVFKLTKRGGQPGKRIFKMTPLHHHFEISGWKEPKIVFRFVIVAVLFALLSLTTLKLR